MAVIEAEAEQDVRVLQLSQVRTLQQALVLLDCAPDLSLLAIEISEDEVDLERIAGGLSGRAQLLDGLIDLIGNQEIETEHVMRRFTGPASIDPPAVLQLVPLPRLADDQARKKCQEDDECGVGTH